MEKESASIDTKMEQIHSGIERDLVQTYSEAFSQGIKELGFFADSADPLTDLHRLISEFYESDYDAGRMIGELIDQIYAVNELDSTPPLDFPDLIELALRQYMEYHGIQPSNDEPLETQDAQSKPLELKDLTLSEFTPYRKSALTKARKLTEADFIERNGTVKTLEGDSTFRVGDYLAVGPHGEEYPIRADFMKETKVLDSAIDDTWSNYRTTIPVLVKKMDRVFSIVRKDGGTYSGKAGDRLVIFQDGLGIVDNDIFEKTYTEYEPD